MSRRRTASGTGLAAAACGACLALLTVCGAEKNSGPTRIVLKNFRTRGMAPDGGVSWDLRGAAADVTGTMARVTDVTVILHPDRKVRRVVLRSPTCRLDRRRRTVRSRAAIHVDAGAYTLDGVGYDFDIETSRLRIHSRVHMRIPLDAQQWTAGRKTNDAPRERTGTAGNAGRRRQPPPAHRNGEQK